jgi:hypothetical protein
MAPDRTKTSNSAKFVKEIIVSVGTFFFEDLITSVEVVWSIPAAYRTGSVRSEPLIDTFGMELMWAGQDSEHLSGFKIAHTHDARCLITLVSVSVELIAEKRFDL